MGTDDRETKSSKWWQPVIAIATIAVAGVGGWATTIYNEQQTRLQEMQTVERFFPYLVSKDPRLSAMARLTVKKVLRDEKLARELIVESVKVESERDAVLPRVSALSARSRADFDKLLKQFNLTTSPKASENFVPTSSANTGTGTPEASRKPDQPTLVETEREGWAYLGEYAEGEWRTRYFNFSDTSKPEDLKGETWKVREETSALNVRLGMPKPDGQFPRVIDVLKAGVPVTIQEVRNWQSTGYTWARISYKK